MFISDSSLVTNTFKADIHNPLCYVLIILSPLSWHFRRNLYPCQNRQILPPFKKRVTPLIRLNQFPPEFFSGLAPDPPITPCANLKVVFHNSQINPTVKTPSCLCRHLSLFVSKVASTPSRNQSGSAPVSAQTAE